MQEAVKILFVDDDESFLDLTKIYLEHVDKNLNMITATSANKALSLIENRGFDVVIADYIMPEMNGLELLEKLRSQGNKIPVIILTGMGSDETMVRALNLGADYYIEKKLNIEALYAELRHFIISCFAKSQIETTLLEREKKFLLTFEHAQDAIIWISSETNTIINCNKAAEVLLKRKKIDIIGQHQIYIYPPQKGEYYLDLILSNLKEEADTQNEILVINSSGKSIPVRVSVLKASVSGKQIFQYFLRDISQEKLLNEELKKVTQDLAERVKELNCLYSSIQILNDLSKSCESKIHKIANILPKAWQYPEDTCAQIRIGENVFKTDNFKESQWFLTADIKIFDLKGGDIQIYYTKKHPTLDEGPFLKEEIFLLNNIASQISCFLEREVKS